MLCLLEAAHPAFVEVDLCTQGLYAQRETLGLDARSRDVSDQAAEDFVVQAIPLRLSAALVGLPDGGGLVEARLGIQRLDQCLRVEEQSQ